MKGFSPPPVSPHAAMAASARCVAPGILARRLPRSRGEHPRSRPRRSRTRLRSSRRRGPNTPGGLANHGPMAAEALVALERPDAVVPWVEKYKRRLQTHPGGRKPIDPTAWREALGDNPRVGDWIVLLPRRARRRVPGRSCSRSGRRGSLPESSRPHFTARSARPTRCEASRSRRRRRASPSSRRVSATGRPRTTRCRRSRRPARFPPDGNRRTPSRPCRSCPSSSASTTATSPTGSRLSTTSRRSPRWPTPSTPRATRQRS